MTVRTTTTHTRKVDCDLYGAISAGRLRELLADAPDNAVLRLTGSYDRSDYYGSSGKVFNGHATLTWKENS